VRLASRGLRDLGSGIERIEEEQALAAMQGVEGDVRLVALAPEERSRRPGSLLRRHEVEVGVRAPERRCELARSPQADRDTAKEPDGDAVLDRPPDHAPALGDDVRVDRAHRITVTLPGA